MSLTISNPDHVSRHKNLIEVHLGDFIEVTQVLTWVFPTIGVPQNGWFILENPIKMDDLGGPIFGNTHISNDHSRHTMNQLQTGPNCFAVRPTTKHAPLSQPKAVRYTDSTAASLRKMAHSTVSTGLLRLAQII